jgi:hypothetical protein
LKIGLSGTDDKVEELDQIVKDLTEKKKKKKNTGLESKCGKVFQANGPQKQAGLAILIFDEVDFRLKSIRRKNEGHIILIKGTIHQEEISILNIYAPDTEAPIYIKKKFLWP